MIAQK